jgi:hypothetical protein
LEHTGLPSVECFYKFAKKIWLGDWQSGDWQSMALAVLMVLYLDIAGLGASVQPQVHDRRLGCACKQRTPGMYRRGSSSEGPSKGRPNSGPTGNSANDAPMWCIRTTSCRQDSWTFEVATTQSWRGGEHCSCSCGSLGDWWAGHHGTIYLAPGIRNL